MSTMPVYICDRCAMQIDTRTTPGEPDQAPTNAAVVIPGYLIGTDGEHHAPALNYCKTCQPVVAALIAGLFDPTIIAVRSTGDDPINLEQIMSEFVHRPVPVYVYSGLADA